MKLETLTDYWIDYRNATLPNNPTFNQVQETKRVFFAGAFALKILLCNLPEEDDDKFDEYVEKINDEINSFLESVKQGKA